jgi:uncharacterized protein (UPF0276 family)
MNPGFRQGSPRGISGAGIGLRLPHIDRILTELPEVPWLEVLADNHLVAGGPLLHGLEQLRADYPLTLHCIGMSPGGTDPLDEGYLRSVRKLADHLDIDVVSDHLCFTRHNGESFPDLLPLPYTEEALTHVTRRVSRIQERLGRRLLVENVSAYLGYRHSTIPEGEFLAELAQRADCLLLVDVNNAWVNAVNLGAPVGEFLAALPTERVAQAHLAGFEDRGDYLLDAHNSEVSEAVWEWYRVFVRMFPGIPVLIEWDNDLPPLETLLNERRKAAAVAAAGGSPERRTG